MCRRRKRQFCRKRNLNLNAREVDDRERVTAWVCSQHSGPLSRIMEIRNEKSTQLNIRSQSGSIYHESRGFGKQGRSSRELLEEVMAFRDQTLEVELQLEEALKTARREARAMIRQMDGSSSDGSARFNDLDPRNSKPKANERLPELKLPVSSGKK
ncbi:hypothetical protein T4D_14477 [Trichinella pseudospiralis]|uniref:Uncharacterized protein n=1 Tax=Trichinella pseudospiralis TaxID=6337 RepID=A0A0V1F5N3_TRIPS|nr:hypothetical protein T4D_14477 [Trichinella pseudospiralis]